MADPEADQAGLVQLHESDSSGFGNRGCTAPSIGPAPYWSQTAGVLAAGFETPVTNYD